jgi:hypothetical protein
LRQRSSPTAKIAEEYLKHFTGRMSEVEKGGGTTRISKWKYFKYYPQNALVSYDKRRHNILTMFETENFENVITAVHRH